MNNNNYLNAADARKLTKESLDRMQTEFLDKIMPEIKTQAKIGKSSLSWHYKIPANAVNMLTDLGYKVKDLYNQKDGYTYEISW